MAFVLDAYAARSCPLKTVHAFTPALVAPSLERPVPMFFHDADAVEADVVARLVASGVGVADLRGLRDRPSDEQERAALAALADGVDVVVHPLMPRDWEQHRSGRPTLLVKAPNGSGYLPVQVKFHRVLESQGPDEPPTWVSSLRAVRTEVVAPLRRFRWGTRLAAALQVAHHWRLLERTGFAAATPRAGLVGLDQIVVGPDPRRRPELVVTWLDLHAPVVPHNPRDLDDLDDLAAAPLVSTLERYDAEHAFRVELAERALAASGQESLLTPVISPECRHCVWQQHCQAQLDADDLSVRIVKAPLDVHEVRTLRRLGVTTVAQLAEADLDALLGAYLPRVSHREAGEARLRRAHRRARLMDAGVELERLGDSAIDLPAHELEIDIDIETSADDRVYLWGFWVHDGERQYYRDFSRFTDLDDAAERELAGAAFAWLRELTAGRDAAVYHYSEYETIRIGRLAAQGDGELAAWVRTFVAEAFVDLFALVKRHYFGANGLGLKVVAGAVTGFAWRDEDPSGLASQRWFDEAVHAEDADARRLARVRVLEYNEDDVRATWHLRRWLREQG